MYALGGRACVEDAHRFSLPADNTNCNVIFCSLYDFVVFDILLCCFTTK